MTPAWTYRIAAVVKVHDGDTVTLKIDLGFDICLTGTFRLAGIDTPELRGSTKIC
jgi:endonuclease YncB( thermonuclease family)